MVTDDWACAQALWKSWPEVSGSHPADGTCGRLRDALVGVRGGQADWRDVAALTRQVMLEHQACHGAGWPLVVPVDPLLPDRRQWEQAGCEALSTPDGWSLTPRPWHPAADSAASDEVAGVEMMDVYARRAPDPVTYPADPFWSATLGPQYQHYTSLGQRQAARSVVMAPPGSTVIVCLPTGQGKTELAWVAALPASRHRGVTVVVVPTVVLAMDLERRLQRLLTALDEPHSPTGRYAYTGGLPDDVKRAIRRDIQEGRQRVVIAAPEALLTGLSHALDAAARQGYLSHLVLDEAHLVEQWGNGFRPEFQAMSGQRRAWLAMAPPGRQVVTLAMSATLTQQQIRTLQDLFGARGYTSLVWAAKTRREPCYFVDRFASEDERSAAVLQALTALPRPMILYTTRKADAQVWRNRLREAGIRRVTEVTGDVNDADRRDAVLGWRGEDPEGESAPTRYDIVVGTSAFGLGLDMPNVRSVVHACLPETLDRFYQEVGRGGRDRRPAVAYLALGPGDADTAARVNHDVVISVEKGWARWTSLYRSATDLGQGRRDVSLDEFPPYLRDESGHNRQWNVRTLNLMARAKMITLEVPQPPTQDGSETDEQWHRRLDDYYARSDARVVVQVRDGRTNDRSFWERAVETQRTGLIAEQRRALDQLHTLIRGGRCVGEVVADHYRTEWNGGLLTTAVNCRGCPHCRRGPTGPGPTGLHRAGYEPFPAVAYWPTRSDPLRHLRGASPWLSIWWRAPASRDDLLPQLLGQLARRGVTVAAGPGLNERLTTQAQREARPKPVIVDFDENLTETFPGPLVWVCDESPSLPPALRARLQDQVVTYVIHGRDLPDPERPHTPLRQTADASLSLETALGAL